MTAPGHTAGGFSPAREERKGPHQAECLDAYIALAGIADHADAPLWQNAPVHGGKLSGEALSERDVLGMVKRLARRPRSRPPDRRTREHQDHQVYNRSGDRKRRHEVERVQL
jgi:hypothetical protein